MLNENAIQFYEANEYLKSNYAIKSKQKLRIMSAKIFFDLDSGLTRLMDFIKMNRKTNRLFHIQIDNNEIYLNNKALIPNDYICLGQRCSFKITESEFMNGFVKV